MGGRLRNLKKKTCPNCGRGINEKWAFCPMCGYKLKGGEKRE